MAAPIVALAPKQRRLSDICQPGGLSEVGLSDHPTTNELSAMGPGVGFRWVIDGVPYTQEELSRTLRAGGFARQLVEGPPVDGWRTFRLAP